MQAIGKQHHSWTARRIVARSIDVLLDEGLQSLWFKILGEVAYRRLLLLGRRLDQPSPKIKTRLAIEFDIIDEPEFETYLRFRLPDEIEKRFLAAGLKTDPADLIRNRFNAEHKCFVARYQQRIISATWSGLNSAPVSYLRGDIRLNANEVYFFDSYTDREFRGRAAAPALAVEMIEHFRKLGYEKVITAVSPENRANLRARQKTGFQPCGRIGYVGLRRWKRVFSSPDRGRLRPW